MNGMIRSIAAALLGSTLLAGTAAEAAIYAVVVGIDDYQHETPLDGAAADARDLASVLRARGADVTHLPDREATRSNIIAALRSAMNRAQPGDSVVLTYAGHGARFPEALPGDEIDGQDETWVLAGFAPRGAPARERIRDNDLASVLMEAREGVAVLVIADSCHSGTMTRTPGGPSTLGKRRWSPSSNLQDDPLDQPKSATYQLDENAFGGVIFASGARDDQTVIEVDIDGQRRGVLSWAMARALEGNVPGVTGEVTLADVRAFVRAEVRQRTYAHHEADLTFPDALLADAGAPEAAAIRALLNPGMPDARGERYYFNGGGGPEVNNVPTNGGGGDTAQGAGEAADDLALAKPQDADKPAEKPADDATNDTSATEGDGAPAQAEATPPLAMHPEPQVFEPAAGQSVDAAPVEAKLIYDAQAATLTDRVSGDLIAQPKDAKALGEAILAWRAARGLSAWVPGRPAEPRLAEGDGRHQVGDHITLVLSPPDTAPEMRHVLLVNLAATGQVQYVFPSDRWVEQGRDRIKAHPERTEIARVPVIEPVGADNLVAIFSSERLDTLRTELQALDGTVAPQGLLELLETHAGDPETARVGLLTIYTGAKQ